mgnify:CR=1 FL=1
MSKKVNPIDKDKIAENAGLLPYASHIGSAIIKPIESGKIKVVKIDTKDQEADILTKPLPVQQFEKLRKLLLNW